MKKTIISFISIIILFIITMGIFYRKDTKNNNLQRVIVSEVAHSVFYTPLYVAKNLGFFEEQGLDVDIVLTSGADAVAASIISDDANIGFCGSEQTIYIYNEGAKDYLINFAGLTKRDGSFIVSRFEENFKLENLIGKHIIAGREGPRINLHDIEPLF